ncbi:MAG: SRPBCC domain-containing protein [Sphingomonadaceae bacterium]
MTTFATTRDIAAPVEQVFAAISTPQRLARWWGPAGFRNTFAVCEFRPGGRWSFVMHGPDGQDYQNDSIFAEIEVPQRVVIDHVCEPRFRLTIGLTPTAGGTLVAWTQVLENAELARQFEAIVVPANEQNLDRLTAEVTSA